MKKNTLKFSPLQFGNLWLFLPLLLLLLYGPQMLVGIFIFGDKAAYELVGVMTFGVIVYVSVCVGLSKLNISSTFAKSQPARLAISTDAAVAFIFVTYFFVIAYAVLTSERVALLEALSGASVDDIVFAREALFKNRVGWEKSLPYINAMLSSALMPFALAICYVEKKPWRHGLLILFAVSLLPSLEKALILKALLPIVLLGFNGYFSKRNIIYVAATIVVVIGAMFFVAKVGKIDATSENEKSIKMLELQKTSLLEMNKSNQKSVEDLNLQIRSLEKKEIKSYEEKKLALEKQINFQIYIQAKQISSGLESVDKQLIYYKNAVRYVHKYFVFGPGQLNFLLNRVFWIPYVTAYDWLGYFNERLNGKLLLGRTSSLLAAIAGQSQFPMEREVFKYQFGEGGPQTAAANGVFLADAFVNFGWYGVLIYATLFALLTKIVMMQSNPAMQACYYYFALQISMGGMPGVLFSNGMLLLVGLSFLVRPALNRNTEAI